MRYHFKQFYTDIITMKLMKPRLNLDKKENRKTRFVKKEKNPLCWQVQQQCWHVPAFMAH